MPASPVTKKTWRSPRAARSNIVSIRACALRRSTADLLEAAGLLTNGPRSSVTGATNW
jgi:hypothetical protein